MQSRVSSFEETKDLATKAQSRVFQLNLLKILILFLVLGLGFSVLSMYMMRFSGVQNVVSTTRSSFQPCFEEPTGLDHWIMPPRNLMHTMTDKELFWRATLVPRMRKYPFKRVPKIAFMFLTKGPLPLSPLWERFLKGHEGLFSIYIHSLPSYRANFTSTSVFYQRQIPSEVSEWGQMSMCDAERRLLANALLDISNEWFVLLSETCIPLFNFSIIYKYLTRSRHSFMGAFDDPGQYGRGRYNESMAPEVNISQWRKGSQWFAISRWPAVYIVEDTKFYPKFKEFCKPHCYVDEHYFPTMLTSVAPRLLANRTLTWVDWSRGGAHPATFGRADITEEFLNRIIEGRTCLYNNRSSSVCYLFARKFAPSTLEPLLQYAQQVLGYG
ncbi:glycosyltransferase BC10-like [Magnolia sinica]|uniref:glycosyltransferase BC10-like n=1 Tax=Magnolia sinica TaxID=86752 RepID=UPI0026583D37|nr:glycosyltransferase BC10-like [Magnolia sinica]